MKCFDGANRDHGELRRSFVELLIIGRDVGIAGRVRRRSKDNDGNRYARELRTEIFEHHLRGGLHFGDAIGLQRMIGHERHVGIAGGEEAVAEASLRLVFVFRRTEHQRREAPMRRPLAIAPSRPASVPETAEPRRSPSLRRRSARLRQFSPRDARRGCVPRSTDVRDALVRSSRRCSSRTRQIRRLRCRDAVEARQRHRIDGRALRQFRYHVRVDERPAAEPGDQDDGGGRSRIFCTKAPSTCIVVSALAPNGARSSANAAAATMKRIMGSQDSCSSMKMSSIVV